MRLRGSIQRSYARQVSSARRLFCYPPCSAHEIVLKGVAIRAVSCSVFMSNNLHYEELTYLNRDRVPPAERNLCRDR